MHEKKPEDKPKPPFNPEVAFARTGLFFTAIGGLALCTIWPPFFFVLVFLVGLGMVYMTLKS